MSLPTTPSLLPASDASSPHSASSVILTPSRKVKALLAQFDDTDSDEHSAHARANIEVKRNEGLKQKEKPLHVSSAELRSARSESHDDEDDVALSSGPRGRLAARVHRQSDKVPSSESGDSDENTNAYERIKRQGLQSGSKSDRHLRSNAGTTISSSEDELRIAEPRKRPLKRKTSSPEQEADSDPASLPSSPLFIPSPAAVRRSLSPSKPGRGSDSEDLPQNPLASTNPRFLALVEKHREQRLAKEAADVAKRAARVEQLQSLSSGSRTQRGSSPADDSGEESDLSSDGAGRKMTKQARPTRKAGKKALEEMNRETQRMSRNMQLAHQAKTKTKITKESLLARFSFTLPAAEITQPLGHGHTSTTASSTPTSDAEAPKEHDTPRTSPLPPDRSEDKIPKVVTSLPKILEEAVVTQYMDDLPSADDLLTRPIQNLDKGKGKAIERASITIPVQARAAAVKKEIRPISVKWSREDAVIARAADSDSDLEIITAKSKTRKFSFFESLPQRKATEMPSHLALRSLAQVASSVDKSRSAMNAAEMEAHLRHTARLQARKERQDKIEELKAKGVIIQTAEEREKDQHEVEDLVERARHDAAEIQKREKECAKNNGIFVKDRFDDDSDDEEDGNFQEDDEIQDEEDADSDEEDEVVGTGDEDEDEDEDIQSGLLLENEADENDSVQESEDDDAKVASNTEDEAGVASAVRRTRKPRVARVLSDEEDEEEEEQAANLLPSAAKIPRSARKMIPGLEMSDDLPMGLTQAFAATMADSQTQEDAYQNQQDSVALPHQVPSPGFPVVPTLNRLESVDVVTDSQPASQTQPLNIDLSFSQSQIADPSSENVSTQLSEAPFEPTQDGGYVLSPFGQRRFDTPVRRREFPSTIDTVILADNAEDSPVLQRKGRLRRGHGPVTSGSGEEHSRLNADQSVFDVMRNAGRKARATEAVFDKSKSYAQEIVDEAAEESDDEYAGLGGASDDEVGDENEDDREMIDLDEGLGKGDESKLAGLYADKERKQDEAAVSKLLKDITTGALRRKRGAAGDLDLSDEDDAASRRREAKQREFARMRRELLKDEAVGKIAEDQKKAAFLKSIEDRDDVDEDEDLGIDDPDTPEAESQSQSQEVSTVNHVPPKRDDKTHVVNQKRKKPLEPSASDLINRLPPTLRCTSAKPSTSYNKPSTLAEIRETVSFLIEEPDSHLAEPDLSSSDDEDEEPEAYVNLDRHLNEADENADADCMDDLGDFIVDDCPDTSGSVFKKPDLPSTSRAPFHQRRTNSNVVDRLSLLRQASSSTGVSSQSSKMAFFTSKSGSSDMTWKVPSLLRRATTNSSIGSVDAKASATGVTLGSTERGAANDEKHVIRKGASGGRGNAVNCSARARGQEREEKSTSRAGVGKKNIKGTRGGKKGGGGFLGGLFGGGAWE